MKLKCKKCGNEESFYIWQKFSGIAEFMVDKNGDLTFDNTEALDDATYKLISKYYFCEECDSKVAKIPEGKQY